MAFEEHVPVLRKSAIFYKKMNKEGAIAGMVVGIVSMLLYMMKFKFDMFGGGTPEDWWFGISPEGFGTVAMKARNSSTENERP